MDVSIEIDKSPMNLNEIEDNTTKNNNEINKNF